VIDRTFTALLAAVELLKATMQGALAEQFVDPSLWVMATVQLFDPTESENPTLYLKSTFFGVWLAQFVPSLTRRLPAVPALVRLVPPFAVGRAVPEYVNAKVPDVVTGDPAIESRLGTEAATLVTVPPPAPFTQH
jgi:hypothetical protein